MGHVEPPGVVVLLGQMTAIGALGSFISAAAAVITLAIKA